MKNAFELVCTLDAPPSLEGTLSNIFEYSAEITQSASYPTYDGDEKVVPCSDPIILNTKDRVLTKDIIIEPVPSNYGLISWDGSSLTVS